MNRGIWVSVEQSGEKPTDVTIEILSEMRRVADQTDDDLAAVILGAPEKEFYARISEYGVNQIYQIKNNLPGQSSPSELHDSLARLIQEFNPWLFVGAASSVSRDVFPRLSITTAAKLVTNCRVVSPLGENQIHLAKPVYGGKVYANTSSDRTGTVMATISQGVFSPSEPLDTVPIKVTEIASALDSKNRSAIKKIGHLKADLETIDITEAEMILAGGRGLGNRENFRQLEKLGQLMKAVTGGSRPAVDNEWISYEKQIGQSGKTVKPEIYIACGISGDSYHVNGMRDARFVIAINLDKNAPIFKAADVGVVGDINRLIPAMMEIYSKTEIPDMDE